MVETDGSNASYFFAAGAITGGRVRVPHLSTDSLQGDAQFVDVLERMGCVVTRTVDYLEVQRPDRLRGTDEDMIALSDTAQTLAAIAPFADSPVTIRHAGAFRHQ